MYHVYGLTTKGFWFFLIAIIIYSARSIIWERSVSCLLNFEFTGQNLTVALHGLATRRLQSLFWFQKLIKVSTIYSILHPETILCIFWILSLSLLSNRVKPNTTVFGTQCYTVQVHVNEKFRMNRSLTKPFLLKTSYISAIWHNYCHSQQTPT